MEDIKKIEEKLDDIINVLEKYGGHVGMVERTRHQNVMQTMTEQTETLKEIAENIKSVNVKTDKMITTMKTLLNKVEGQ